MSGEKWSIECDYMESCNCDFGCACNFSGFPNYRRCEALVGYHIRRGNYGNVRLDGVDFIYAASWPRAIHEGNGTMRVYIADRASDEQRSAIAEIAYGRRKETVRSRCLRRRCVMFSNQSSSLSRCGSMGNGAALPFRGCSKSNSLRTSIPLLERSRRCVLTFPTVSFSRTHRRSRPR